jgi:1-acyl-sn-glycerol-3-phosphate acyltransferase
MKQTPAWGGPTSLGSRILHAAIAARLASYDVSSEADSLPSDRSIICVGNHVCSLDSWIAYDITHRFFRRQFIHLGEASVLARFPALRRFGVLPVTASDPLLTMRSMSTVGRALRADAGVAAWIFPTGSHSPSDPFVGTIKPGLQALARLAGDSVIVPVGILYYVYRKPKISVWVHVGKTLGSSREVSHADWQTVARETTEGIEGALREASVRVLARIGD